MEYNGELLSVDNVRLVRLESGGAAVFVNPAEILYIADSRFGSGCRIVFDGAAIEVSESADEVAALLTGELADARLERKEAELDALKAGLREMLDRYAPEGGGSE